MAAGVPDAMLICPDCGRIPDVPHDSNRGVSVSLACLCGASIVSFPDGSLPPPGTLAPPEGRLTVFLRPGGRGRWGRGSPVLRMGPAGLGGMPGGLSVVHGSIRFLPLGAGSVPDGGPGFSDDVRELMERAISVSEVLGS